MSEFAFIFRGRDTTSPPEVMQPHLQKWLAWFKELDAQRHIRNPGHPLEAAGSVVRGKQKVINDGPYAEAKDVVGGFMIVEARDLAHASQLATGCPILDVGGSVEVRPTQQLNT